MRMALYAFHEVTLAVQTDGNERERELERLLEDLSFVRTPASERAPGLSLVIHRGAQAQPVPATAGAVFQAEGLAGFAHGEHFYLTAGTSLLHLRPE